MKKSAYSAFVMMGVLVILAIIENIRQKPDDIILLLSAVFIGVFTIWVMGIPPTKNNTIDNLTARVEGKAIIIDVKDHGSIKIYRTETGDQWSMTHIQVTGKDRPTACRSINIQDRELKKR